MVELAEKGERLLGLCEAPGPGVQSVEPGEAWLDTKRRQEPCGDNLVSQGAVPTPAFGVTLWVKGALWLNTHPLEWAGRCFLAWSDGQADRALRVLLGCGPG